MCIVIDAPSERIRNPFLPFSLSLHPPRACIVHNISHLPYNIGIPTQQLTSPGFENLPSKHPPVPTIALGTSCKTGHTTIRLLYHIPDAASPNYLTGLWANKHIPGGSLILSKTPHSQNHHRLTRLSKSHSCPCTRPSPRDIRKSPEPRPPHTPPLCRTAWNTTGARSSTPCPSNDSKRQPCRRVHQGTPETDLENEA